MTTRSFAFIAHYVEDWNWLLRWCLFSRLHTHPAEHFYWSWLWPIYTVAALLDMIGKKSFDVVDDFAFGKKLRGRTVLLRNFAWQFFIPQYRDRIRERILKTVLETQKFVEVIGLGALIKDESLTRGGEWIVEKLGSQLKVPIVHGDTLTAATVFEQVMALREKRGLEADDPVMVTGSTSKIGRAIVLLLAEKGIKVKMFTLSNDRFLAIKTEAGAKSENIEWASSLSDGKCCPIWVTGKSIPRGRDLLDLIPYEADVLNFAVPNPLNVSWKKTRSDLVFHEGGLLAYKPDTTSLRFTMRLRPGLTYACHAGTMVHAAMGWTHHEVGQVDIPQIEVTWKAALELGFSLPPLGERELVGNKIEGEVKQLKSAKNFLSWFF
ncbi:MAG: hypothetical protein WCV68_00485 [Candidatus Paceibacterota bacterium]|jgi:predicted amino acid dehydrogenase